MIRRFATATCVLLAWTVGASAGVKTQAARQAAEYVMGKFGKEAAEQGVETLTRKIEVLAVKHGDDAITAVRRVGPRALGLIDEAGENAPKAVQLLARHGDEAVWVAGSRARLGLFTKYGDDAAEAMIKHGEIAEPLVKSFGEPAAGALKAVSAQNGRRLAMMADDGALAGIGRSDQLLAVVGKYGDKAMDFVWKNKGGLAVAGALTAFLANPEPFIDGSKDFAQVVAENVGKPLASLPGQVAEHAARNTNWTWLLSVLAVLAAAYISFKTWLRHRRAAA